MHIYINNKFISYNNYKAKCAVGKRGISIKKKEGDFITPKGTFKIREIFYRKDRVQNLITKIKKTVIRKNMGWCDDPKSKKYNKLIYFPFKHFERLSICKCSLISWSTIINNAKTISTISEFRFR